MSSNFLRLTLGLMLVAILMEPDAAQAQVVPVNACAAAKARCMGGQVKALLRCHQTAETKGVVVAPICLQKAADKFASCFAKAEAKLPCLTLGDRPALAGQIDAWVQYLVPQLDPSYPTPTKNKCSAGKKKAVALSTASRLVCLSRAFKKQPGVVDSGCLAKAEAKLAQTIARVELKNPPCLTTGDAADLEGTVDAFFADATAGLTGMGGLCGNGQNDPGEACDGSAPSSGWTGCGAGFFCSACSCGCPTRYEIAVDDADPASRLDLGWTGLGHRQPFSTNNTFTLGLSCSASVRPCGTCTFTNLVPNSSGRIANRRCSNDTSIRCTSDTPCTAGGGACRYYLGSWHPRGGFGLGGCIAHEIADSVGGNVDLVSGAIALSTTVTRRSYSGPVDNPCPRCSGDVTDNDGIADGICDAGPRAGLPCDGNATQPGFPDFGATSLDCPPFASFVADVTLSLASATQSVVRTVSAFSPSCGDGSGEKCLCDTCNNANAEPCSANSDCPDPPGSTGPVCGGRRCAGGVNDGAPCTLDSECPSGLCGRSGEPSKTSGCLDDTTTPGVLDCVDTAPFDGEGECTDGPVTKVCTTASGHPQRLCNADADCGGGSNTCESRNRSCLLTGSAPGFGRAGTGTLVADGVVDVPIQDVAHPVLAAVGCVGASSSSPLNSISGFPGPLRLTERVTATALP